MSSFKTATGKSIQSAFDAYHELNPQVYTEVKRLALTAIRRGRKKISFKLIVNVIRWERFIDTEEPTTVTVDGEKVAFKINDAYSSRYARLFAEEHPEHVEKIEFRELRSERGSKLAFDVEGRTGTSGS